MAIVRKLSGVLAVVSLLSALPTALAQTPVPFVNVPLVPGAAAPGDAGFTLTVHGTGFVSGATVDWNGSPLPTGFVSGATVDWNGSPLPTAFVSGAQLTATVPAKDIASATTASISVVNPGTSVASNVVSLPIVALSPTVLYTNVAASPLYLGQADSQPNLPEAMAAGDFNGDGKLDFALAMWNKVNAAYFEIFLGNGDGTFNPLPTTMPLSSTPTAMIAGDFNGDGKPDLALANYYANTVTILLGNGDGTFTLSTDSPIAVGNAPYGLAEGDFNGDGKLDLAVSNGNDNTLSILLGNGDGTFTANPSRPETGLGPTGIAVGDFNGDGKLDLAVANYDTGLSILLGNGDGTFTAPPTQPVLPSIAYAPGFAIVAGDFNGDGNLDLAASNPGNPTVTVWRGNGDGTFTPVKNCCGNSVPFVHTYGMLEGDFNGDGRPDLALVTDQGLSLQAPPIDYITVLLGNANGTFAPTNFSLLLPNSPFSFVTGDFNNDGKFDFSAASAPDNYLSVLLQPSANPLPAPDFSISTPATPLVLQAGTDGTSSVNVTSLNGFTGYVLVSCSGAPAMATCSVPSPIFMADTVIATTSVTVTTFPPAAPVGITVRSSSNWPRGIGAAILGLMLLATFVRARQRPTLPSGLAIATIGLAFLVGCGGSKQMQTQSGPTGTPPGTYTLVVKATSGSLTHSANITLTVN